MKGIIECAGQRVHYYLCDNCKAEVYSLLCRRIDGKDWDICFECWEQERREEQ